MRFKKEVKAKLNDLETFETSFCKVIEGYFSHNDKPKQKYYTNCSIGCFYNFVASVDDRITELENKIKVYEEEIRIKNNTIEEQKLKIEKLSKPKKGANK